MALFVAAAKGRILPKKRPTTEVELSDGQEARRVFMSLVPFVPSPYLKASAPEASTLSEAFLALWQHYAGDERQASLCARVLGFHLLMERTEGAAVGRWLVPNPDDPETVLLDPAVIEAIALVPLTADGLFSEDLFKDFLAAKGHE